MCRTLPSLLFPLYFSNLKTTDLWKSPLEPTSYHWDILFYASTVKLSSNPRNHAWGYSCLLRLFLFQKPLAVTSWGVEVWGVWIERFRFLRRLGLCEDKYLVLALILFLYIVSLFQLTRSKLRKTSCLLSLSGRSKTGNGRQHDSDVFAVPNHYKSQHLLTFSCLQKRPTLRFMLLGLSCCVQISSALLRSWSWGINIPHFSTLCFSILLCV